MSMAEPPRRRSGRPADRAKHDAILDAAAQAFFEHGYAGASIEGIAAAAGVSKVTVYNHFADKSALFTAAVERECSAVRSLLLLQEDGGSIRTRLISFGHAVHAFLGQPKIVRFDRRIAAEAERDPELGRMFLDAGPRRMLGALADLLRRGVASGELEVEDAQLAAELLVGMMKGVADLERRFGGEVEPSVLVARVEAAVDLFLCGFGTTELRPGRATAE